MEILRTSLKLEASPYSAGGGSSNIWYTQYKFNGSRLLFKEYRTDSTGPQISLLKLRKLVAWPISDMSENESSHLYELCAFPLGVVTGQNQPLGVLIPELPSGFLRAKGEIRDAYELARKAPEATIGKPYFPLPYKLAALGAILETVIELHERGIVVGDLQPRNIAMRSAGDRVVVRILDCDSMVVHGNAAQTPISPDVWKISGEDDGFTAATDLAKFCALACRSLRDRAAGPTTPGPDLLSSISPSHLTQLGQMSRLSGIPSKSYLSLARDWKGAVDQMPDEVRLYSWPNSIMRKQHENASSPWGCYEAVLGSSTLSLDLWPPTGTSGFPPQRLTVTAPPTRDPKDDSRVFGTVALLLICMTVIALILFQVRR